MVMVKYKKGGKVVSMAPRYAAVLVKVGQAVYYVPEEAPAKVEPKKIEPKALTAEKPKKQTKPKSKKTEYKTRALTAGDL